ncbi:Beta-monoglucosyldiacylglycerol synthase [Shimia sp. SK013]|uniref:glycosyltransferase n=1 Tax=Shimia sp. SK013 TaxID=1389006 RepID=UPI0006B68FB6|nr:glycosyltransferase [Shimia sp. SK013]KPA20093.1 Beta-monoglucosyldiacylglycerol synthase [Shimia sp. SK013]
MNEPRPNLEPRRLPTQDLPPLPLGRTLVERAWITPWQLFFALHRQKLWDATLPEILLSRGWLSRDRYWRLHSERTGMRLINLNRLPPEPGLFTLLPPEVCLKHNILPWRRLEGRVCLATGRPDRLAKARRDLPLKYANAPVVIAPEDQVTDLIACQSRRSLTSLAEHKLHPQYSSRGWDRRSMTQKLALACLLVGILIWAALATNTFFLAAMAWALISLGAATALRIAAMIAFFRRSPRAPPPTHHAPLPRISVMVPLFREKEIAQALIRRLTRLTYPRALLDVVLVLEQNDTLTHTTIARTALPKWMRVVVVPEGTGVTTKPRALNYALDFCKGDIIGIWDAEDAPAPDQLEQVANHFATAPSDVACLQGILDYYNPHTNWLSRCFTIEYATWFRIILPGLSRLKLAIPLGGTTLFLRRHVIEEVGGWDAHNVTEDADLGYRLARFGYRSELINTVTMEEANCRPVAWVRQRSRWLKGFMVTYLVHMRTPLDLWRDLGPRQFFGFQLVFLSTLSQFLLAPLLWMLWGATFGLTSPMWHAGLSSPPLWLSLGLIFATLSNLSTWITAAVIINRKSLII